MSEETSYSVCVVDDDDAVRLSIRLLIETLGIRVLEYSNAVALLDDHEALRTSHCVVLDVRMPGLSGLAAQERMSEVVAGIPVIFVSGHGDVPMVVRAMREGAFDFIQKPFNDQLLLDRVQEAVRIGVERRRQRDLEADVQKRLDSLTHRERDVLGGILEGRLNKQIAADLGISMKTVEQHRARIMEKMRADGLASLVRMLTRIEGRDAGDPIP